MPKELEKIVKAIKKENPKMDESKAWAIGTAAYKKKKGIKPKAKK